MPVNHSELRSFEDDSPQEVRRRAARRIAEVHPDRIASLHLRRLELWLEFLDGSGHARDGVERDRDLRWLPSYVNETCGNFGGGAYCPWSAIMVELRDCRTNPVCPAVSR